MKKSLDTFIENILTPIERKKVDDGHLYVSLEGFYNYPPLEVGGIKNYDYDFKVEWSLPNNNELGEWCTFKGEIGKGFQSRKIVIESLASLLFHDGLREKLYLVEFQGPSEELKFIQAVHNADYIFNNPPDYLINIYDCLPRSLNVDKARLLRDISSWNVESAWRFAIDCINRVLTQISFRVQKQSLVIPEIYLYAFDLAKEFKAWYCEERFFDGKSLAPKESNTSLTGRTTTLEYELKEIIVKDKDFNHIGEAIRACLSPMQIWRVAQRTRAQYAKNRIQQLDAEYELLADFSFRQRTLQALMKEELNWQTQYLIDIVAQ